jgi:hypothetical protein
MLEYHVCCHQNNDIMEIKSRNMKVDFSLLLSWDVDLARIFGLDSCNIHHASKMNFVLDMYTTRRGLSLSNQRAHVVGPSRQNYFVRKMSFLSLLLFVVMQKRARSLLL